MLRLVAASILAASAASAQVYECTPTKKGSGGWIGSKFFLAYDPADKTGAALDWTIEEVHGKSIAVDTKELNNGRVRFKWTVTGVKSSNGGSSKISYSVRLDRARNTFTLNGRLHGYDNTIYASGTCKKK